MSPRVYSGHVWHGVCSLWEEWLADCESDVRGLELYRHKSVCQNECLLVDLGDRGLLGLVCGHHFLEPVGAAGVFVWDSSSLFMID